ncbi:MAG: M4 family metallopeptidase, partial [Saprospiraceae bacterium]
HICHLLNAEFGMRNAESGVQHTEPESQVDQGNSEFRIPNSEFQDGPVTGNGLDLLNVNHTFGAYQIGSQYLLEDASKPMFNTGNSNMPNDPVGALVTLNAKNTSPSVSQTFDYDFAISTSSTFSDKTAVSTHWNSNYSFDYYKNTFGRNSIDGVGGNILAFYNVSEDNGSSLENAFWNGEAMWYGNGGSTFKQLARGLDVGGHELTHGVVEKTANLEYQDESGALNESMADVFGSMIDRDDWLIGEDVMQPGQSPTGALRSMQDPHNGSNSNGNFWQPRILSEKYNGNQDNGGVHINSGIPNWAFYKFTTNAAVGKDKAEQVYYKALRDYLVKSSQFVDARIAIIQAATDLYGAAVATAAADAFTAVGIVGNQPGGNYLGQLQPNPGADFIICTDPTFTNLDLALGNGNVLGTLYNQGLISRPSVTDDGTQVVFVNDNQEIVGIDFNYSVNPIQYGTSVLSSDPVWRSVAISKDGRYVAAVTDNTDNRVYIFDLNDPFGSSQTFFLYNPTYTQGQTTGDVQYADVMDFDYSGNYLMYDAYNELKDQTGQTIDYWDISFVKFRENGQFVDGANAFISKLFSGLPENTSIGNPSFAKNSPYIIAFDYIDEQADQNDIYGANSQTGDYNVIVSDNGELGYPSYSRLDNALLYQGLAGSATNLYLSGLNPNKIQAQGAESKLIDNHAWGVWYGNGSRSLLVNVDEKAAAALELTASPNPTADALRITFTANSAASVQLSIA